MSRLARPRSWSACTLGSGVDERDSSAKPSPTQSMLTVLVVIARIVTNPLSNIFQKQLAQRSADPFFIIAATHGLPTALGLPLLPGKPLGDLLVVFWASMLTAVALAVVGKVVLVYALRSTDLSVLGPLNRYKAVLSLILAVILIGEVPTLFGFLGVPLHYVFLQNRGE